MAPLSKSHATALFGGNIDNFNEMVKKALHDCPIPAEEGTIRALIHNYGSAYTQIYHYIKLDSELGDTIGVSDTIKGQVVHAVREEMAQTLRDVVLRRTDLGTGEFPGKEAVKVCADVMAHECRWSKHRTEEEVTAVYGCFP